MVGVMINERPTLLLQWRACDEVFIYRFGAGSGRRTALSPFCDRLLKDQLKRLTPEARLPRRRSTCSRGVDRGPCLESGARQRLPSRTTSAPPGLAVSGDTTLLRRFGETFHCRPSSVMTVTVFLL